MSNLCSDTVVFVSLPESWPSRVRTSLVPQPRAFHKLIKREDSAEVFCDPQVNWKMNGIYRFVKATQLRNFSGIVADFT